MKCKKCGSEMKLQEGIVYTSNPVRYGYKCPKCGNVQYSMINEENNQMDYEKKYKQALERAKIELSADTTQGTKNVLMTVFPELKESEDEKIRKALLEMVHDTTGDELWVDYNVHKEEALAWLEKQDEQKPILDFKASNWYVSKVDGKIHDMTYNPTDKVEPKFKVGDVLCDKSCTTFNKNSQPNIEIRDIRNGLYICNNCVFPIEQQDEYELVTKRIESHELMIGDWIFDGNNVAQITGITCDGIIETTVNETSNIEVIHPIPLTSEILEKNGFENIRNNEVFLLKKLSVNVYLGIYLDKDGINIYLQNNDTNSWPGYEYYDLFVIKYVHELQHALRLCSIDKEIIL